uniref:Uncharacterized protein n=1 Tax=Glossina pallidipes TaxID=7398 RepID=A0A1B0A5W8_GLOPL
MIENSLHCWLNFIIFESTWNIVSVISGLMYSVFKLEPKQNRTVPWTLLLLRNVEISLSCEFPADGSAIFGFYVHLQEVMQNLRFVLASACLEVFPKAENYNSCYLILEIPGVFVGSSHFQITFCFRLESTSNMVLVTSGLINSLFKFEPKQKSMAP